MRFCDVEKCATEVHANGLCFKHYMRVRRHGAVDGGRNGDGRIKSHHPLWESWKSALSSGRHSGVGYDIRWNDFWTFVEDMGDRPTPRHSLRRITPKQPFCKENCEWKEPLSEDSQLADKNEYMRLYRLKRPDILRNAILKKNFGITLDQYNEMMIAQCGGCKICKKPETAIDRRTGKPFALAVDHCHAAEKNGKMKIRGLLCNKCNAALGGFNDDIPLIMEAIAYLEAHAT